MRPKVQEAQCPECGNAIEIPHGAHIGGSSVLCPHCGRIVAINDGTMERGHESIDTPKAAQRAQGPNREERPLPFTCPSCRERIIARRVDSGETVSCPYCGDEVVVPRSVGEAVLVGCTTLLLLGGVALGILWFFVSYTPTPQDKAEQQRRQLRRESAAEGPSLADPEQWKRVSDPETGVQFRIPPGWKVLKEGAFLTKTEGVPPGPRNKWILGMGDHRLHVMVRPTICTQVTPRETEAVKALVARIPTQLFGRRRWGHLLLDRAWKEGRTELRHDGTRVVLTGQWVLREPEYLQVKLIKFKESRRDHTLMLWIREEAWVAYLLRVMDSFVAHYTPGVAKKPSPSARRDAPATR